MRSIFKNSLSEAAGHILLWGVFFIFLVFFSPAPYHENMNWRFTISTGALLLFLFAFIFYLNYFFLIERLIIHKKIFVFVLVNILLIVVCSWLNDLLRMPFPQPDEKPFLHFRHPDMGGAGRVLMLMRLGVPFVLPVVLSVAVKITQHWFKTETENKEAENKNLESELQHLRYQVQPHFFFNSLNTIYALIETSPGKAREAVHSLGKLMRYVLYESGNSEVELSQELYFLKKYIELMQLRLTDKTLISYDFESVSGHYKVPPLLFAPLVENAFKHGISGTQPCTLFFEMKTTGGRLYFLAENSNFPKNDLDKSGSGIGLINLRKRLSLLYKGHHTFTTEISGDIFRACLIIDIA